MKMLSVPEAACRISLPMNTQAPDAPAPFPFRRPMAAARLHRNSETQFRVAAEPDELVELARFLDVDRLDRVTLAGFIAPAADGGWRVRGRLVARVVQTCGVTLEPVESRIESDIERLYLPADSVPTEREVQILHDEEDGPDPFTDTIDPAQLAVESLALLIDPYPRAEGAELGTQSFAAPGVKPLTDEDTHPFADLAVLKRRSANDLTDDPADEDD